MYIQRWFNFALKISLPLFIVCDRDPPKPFEDPKLQNYYAKEYLAAIEDENQHKFAFDADSTDRIENVTFQSPPAGPNVLTWNDEQVPGFLPDPTTTLFPPVLGQQAAQPVNENEDDQQSTFVEGTTVGDMIDSLEDLVPNELSPQAQEANLNDQDDLTESSPATSETQTGQQQQQQFSSPSPPSLGSIIGMLKNAYSTDTQSPTLPTWSTTTAHPTLATQLPQTLPPHSLFPANIEPRFPYPSQQVEHQFLPQPPFSPISKNANISDSDTQMQNVDNFVAQNKVQTKLVHRPYHLEVSQLVVGAMQPIAGGFIMTASVTLLRDDALTVLIDTPAATDFYAVGQMIEGFRKVNVRPDQVDILVTTHGHPDHNGFANMFPNARHHFGLYEYSSNAFIRTELYENETMPLTIHADLWTTPGHTTSDVSVVVQGVPGFGVVAIVGDLFYSEHDVMEPTAWLAGAVDGRGLHYRNKVLCIADYIVPGHGKLFRVSEMMRPSKLHCDSLLANLD